MRILIVLLTVNCLFSNIAVGGGMSTTHQAAINSANHQARNGFGHNQFEAGYRSGVGWTSNPNGHPATCPVALFPWNKVRHEVHTSRGTYATEIRRPTGPLARMFRR